MEFPEVCRIKSDVDLYRGNVHDRRIQKLILDNAKYLSLQTPMSSSGVISPSSSVKTSGHVTLQDLACGSGPGLRMLHLHKDKEARVSTSHLRQAPHQTETMKLFLREWYLAAPNSPAEPVPLLNAALCSGAPSLFNIGGRGDSHDVPSPLQACGEGN